MEENQTLMLEECRNYVRTTGKWMNFMAIIATISIVLMAIAGIILICCSAMISASTSYSGDMTAFTNTPIYFIIMGIVYIILAVVMIWPTRYMFKGSKAARNAAELNSNEEMVAFLKNNKSLWKFYGIYTIVCLALIPIIIIACIIIGVAAAM